MSGSIRLSITLDGTVSNLVLGAAFAASITVAGANAIGQVQNVGTSEEVLVFGDVAFPTGLVYVENLSTTETLTLSSDNLGADVLAVIAPGGAPFIASGLAAAPYAAFTIAATALVIACEV